MDFESSLDLPMKPDEQLIRALVSPAERIFKPPNLAREGLIVPEYMKLHLRYDKGVHYGCRFHFGKIRGSPPNHYVGKPTRMDGHILVLGGTGSGKGVTSARPTINTWKPPIFAIDIKGELVTEVLESNGKHMGARHLQRSVRLLDLTGVSKHWKYDPFYFLRQGGESRLSGNIEALTYSIIPKTKMDDSFWTNSARSLLGGLIAYFINYNKHTVFREQMTFINVMEIIKMSDLQELIKQIWNSSDDMAKAFVNQTIIDSEKMFAGISEELMNHIRIFVTDSTIREAFTSSDDKPDNIIRWEGFEEGVSVIIRIDQRDLARWGRVLNLIVSQLMSYLMGRPEKHSPKGKNTKPVLLLLDEFPQLKINSEMVLLPALQTLRSKNVTVALYCQSLTDLIDIYGEHTACRIVENCDYKLILKISDPNIQKHFSDLSGTKQVISKGLSANYSHNENKVTGISLKLSETSQPVIQPHEFDSLNCAVLKHPEGFSLIDNLSHYFPGHPKNPFNKK